MSFEVFSGGKEDFLVRRLVVGEVFPRTIASSIRRGRGIPLASRAGGGVWGVDPKEGGGVASKGDRGGWGVSPSTSVSSKPSFLSIPDDSDP